MTRPKDCRPYFSTRVSQNSARTFKVSNRGSCTNLGKHENDSFSDEVNKASMMGGAQAHDLANFWGKIPYACIDPTVLQQLWPKRTSDSGWKDFANKAEIFRIGGPWRDQIRFQLLEWQILDVVGGSTSYGWGGWYQFHHSERATYETAGDSRALSTTGTGGGHEMISHTERPLWIQRTAEALILQEPEAVTRPSTRKPIIDAVEFRRLEI
ncbi:hypothetical protein B0H13DRAFT_1868564 [Mycena leptocephala]|nr:hypothetical protein B0H13DRAFT_1868564 [Mycena leptocephala]